MENRRKFLKFAGLAALGLCLTPTAKVVASGGPHHHGKTSHAGSKMLHAKRWAMVVDTRKLNTKEAIEPLVEACHKFHNVPDIPTKQNIMWLWHDEYEHTFTEQENNYLSEEMEGRDYLMMCNHCQHPPCVRVCPTKATFQRADGIVIMDMHRCIGCRYCMAACPFGARSFNFQDPRPFLKEENKEYPTRMRGVVEKCNFCAELLAVGELPKCVQASDGAMHFGDLGDKNSEIRKILRENFTIRRKPSLGTEPCVYYII